MLLLYKNVNFGDLKSNLSEIKDLETIEIIYFSLLGFLVIFLGVYPKILFNLIDKSVGLIVL